MYNDEKGKCVNQSRSWGNTEYVEYIIFLLPSYKSSHI